MRNKQAFDGIVDLGESVGGPLVRMGIFAGLMAGKIYAGNAIEKIRIQQESKMDKVRGARREELKQLYLRRYANEKKSADAAYVDGVFAALDRLGGIT